MSKFRLPWLEAIAPFGWRRAAIQADILGGWEAALTAEQLATSLPRAQEAAAERYTQYSWFFARGINDAAALAWPQPWLSTRRSVPRSTPRGAASTIAGILAARLLKDAL